MVFIFKSLGVAGFIALSFTVYALVGGILTLFHVAQHGSLSQVVIVVALDTMLILIIVGFVKFLVYAWKNTDRIASGKIATPFSS